MASDKQFGRAMYKDFNNPTSLLSSWASEDFSFTRIWISSWDGQLFGSAALVLCCIRRPPCPYYIKNGKSGSKDLKLKEKRKCCNKHDLQLGKTWLRGNRKRYWTNAITSQSKIRYVQQDSLTLLSLPALVISFLVN